MSEITDKLDELAAYAVEHGGTLRNHRDFGAMYRHLRTLIEAQDRALSLAIQENTAHAEEADHYEAALHRIEQWAQAYPLDVFPEPDFKRARELLAAGGISLDCVSASNMRHVVEGVGKIARDALGANQ